MPTSTTNAVAQNFDMEGKNVPQTPAGTGAASKVPRLDFGGIPGHEAPQSTTNKSTASGRMPGLISSSKSPNRMAGGAYNTGGLTAAEKAKELKREIPQHEFHDFLQTYDETMW